MAEVQLLKMVGGTPTRHSPTADSVRALSIGVGAAAGANGITNGGMHVTKVVSTNGNYIVGADDHTIATQAGLLAPITVTLPAAPETGREIEVLDDAGLITAVNTVTIDGNGNNIGAIGTLVLAAVFARAVLKYTGTRWSIKS